MPRPTCHDADLAVTAGAYNSLVLGLGAVALLVGGVGVANVMVISVLERRWEIGLRRALGATRRHIAEQFLTEAPACHPPRRCARYEEPGSAALAVRPSRLRPQAGR